MRANEARATRCGVVTLCAAMRTVCYDANCVNTLVPRNSNSCSSYINFCPYYTRQLGFLYIPSPLGRITQDLSSHLCAPNLVPTSKAQEDNNTQRNVKSSMKITISWKDLPKRFKAISPGQASTQFQGNMIGLTWKESSEDVNKGFGYSTGNINPLTW